jgi:hypothetical protein
MEPFLGFAYLAAICACFISASARPQLRGPLIALGVVLLVPVVLGALFFVYLLIAFSNGASF